MDIARVCSDSTDARANRPGAIGSRAGLAGTGERFVAGVVAAGCAVVLGLAAWLEPSAQGHGTHQQLGLPQCSLAMTIDRPCPTCGMTTAFAHAADGHFLEALRAQPMGLALAMATPVAFWGGLHIAATGSRIGEAAGRLLTSRSMWVVLGLFLGSWAYKLLTW